MLKYENKYKLYIKIYIFVITYIFSSVLALYANENYKTRMDNFQYVKFTENLNKNLKQKEIKDNSLNKPLLILAIQKKQNDVVKMMIEKGANINVKNLNGQTPLHVAILTNNIEIAKYLIEKGADLNIKDCKGQTPLYLAILKNNVEIAKLLIKKGANITE